MPLAINLFINRRIISFLLPGNILVFVVIILFIGLIFSLTDIIMGNETGSELPKRRS